VTDHVDVILTALHERRNRLIHLDMENKVNRASVENLRSRINECTDAITALTHAKRGLHV
jgi:hypothetical protein